MYVATWIKIIHQKGLEGHRNILSFSVRGAMLLNHVPYTISYLQQAHVYQDLDGPITLPSPKLTQNGNQSVDLTIAFPVKTVAATYLFIQFLSLCFLVPPTNALLDYSNRPWNVAHPYGHPVTESNRSGHLLAVMGLTARLTDLWRHRLVFKYPHMFLNPWTKHQIYQRT